MKLNNSHRPTDLADLLFIIFVLVAAIIWGLWLTGCRNILPNQTFHATSGQSVVNIAPPGVTPFYVTNLPAMANMVITNPARVHTNIILWWSMRPQMTCNSDSFEGQCRGFWIQVSTNPAGYWTTIGRIPRDSLSMNYFFTNSTDQAMVYYRLGYLFNNNPH